MVKAGYKQTEIGVIPEDWKVVTIQEMLDRGAIKDHLDGNHGALYPRSSEFSDYGVPYISANSLLGARVCLESCKYLPPERANTFKKGITLDGDVLFAHNATVGPTGLLRMNTPFAILSTTVTYYRCDGCDLNNSYLVYQLQADSFVGQYSGVMSQSTRNQVPITAQRSLKIILPPIAEQEAIAGALSDADGLIESLEQLIEKKRQIKQGAMQKLLSPWVKETKEKGERKKDKGTTQKLKEGWVEKTFDEVFSFYSTATNSRSDLGNQGDAYYIHYGDIHTKFHSHLDFRSTRPSKIHREKCPSATILRNGDWIMADASEDYDGVGKSIEISGLEDDVVAVAGLHTFLLREKNDDFVSGFKGHLGNQKRLHEEFLRVATGMKVFGVSKTALKGLNLTIPPKTEQTRITSILSDMDTEISILETKLSKAKQIKQGMMQELLTGKTRLV